MTRERLMMLFAQAIPHMSVGPIVYGMSEIVDVSWQDNRLLITTKGGPGQEGLHRRPGAQVWSVAFSEVHSGRAYEDAQLRVKDSTGETENAD